MRCLAIALLLLALALPAQAGFLWLAWDAPTHDVNGNALPVGYIQMYRVFRQTTTGWTTTQYVPGDVTRCIIVQSDGATNTYAVSAVSGSGLESAKSPPFAWYQPKAFAAPSGVTTGTPPSSAASLIGQ